MVKTARLRQGGVSIWHDIGLPRVKSVEFYLIWITFKGGRDFPPPFSFFEICLVPFFTPKKLPANRSAASMMSLLLPTEQQYLHCRPLAYSLGNIDLEAMRGLDGSVNRGCSMI